MSRAPLREALINIEFEPHVQIDAIDRFFALQADQIRGKSDLWEANFGVTVGAAAASSSIVGRRVDFASKPYVIQCRNTAFTVSRLSPYGKWEELKSETHSGWTKFQEAAGTLRVKKATVRYINAITIPLPLSDFNEYLVCAPTIPASLPQALSGFITKVITPDVGNRVIAVTQALEPPTPGSSAVTVLLDIEVIAPMNIDGNSFEILWQELDLMRKRKNDVFFEYLTEKSMEMYE